MRCIGLLDKPEKIKERDMELKKLIGTHNLSGIDIGSEDYDNGFYTGIRSYVVFVLDDVCYKAAEDPEDGYRSCCTDIEVLSNIPSNTFSPVQVFCEMRNGECDILDIRDAITTKTILSIGTDEYDSYYPCYVCEYSPQNMVCNQ